MEKAKSLESAGWGALLLWIGVTTLFGLGWPTFLRGLGLLVLGVQGARYLWGMKVEYFWVIFGVVFLLAGIVESFGIGFPLVPAALIAFGLAALYGVLRHINDSKV